MAAIDREITVTPMRWEFQLSMDGGFADLPDIKLTLSAGDNTQVHLTLRAPKMDRRDEHYYSRDVRLRHEGRVYRCEVLRSYLEMEQCWLAVSGADDVPQDVLDRAARAMDVEVDQTWPLPLYAALHPGDRCQQCARPLSDPISQILQLGPTCASKMGLPHNQQIADAIYKLRQEQSIN